MRCKLYGHSFLWQLGENSIEKSVITVPFRSEKGNAHFDKLLKYWTRSTDRTTAFTQSIPIACTANYNTIYIIVLCIRHYRLCLLVLSRWAPRMIVFICSSIYKVWQLYFNRRYTKLVQVIYKVSQSILQLLQIDLSKNTVGLNPLIKGFGGSRWRMSKKKGIHSLTSLGLLASGELRLIIFAHNCLQFTILTVHFGALDLLTW